MGLIGPWIMAMLGRRIRRRLRKRVVWRQLILPRCRTAQSRVGLRSWVAWVVGIISLRSSGRIGSLTSVLRNVSGSIMRVRFLFLFTLVVEGMVTRSAVTT